MELEAFTGVGTGIRGLELSWKHTDRVGTGNFVVRLDFVAYTVAGAGDRTMLVIGGHSRFEGAWPTYLCS